MQYHHRIRCKVTEQMRTTLDIDDDILSAAKEIARKERKTAGAVISALARRTLTQASSSQARSVHEPESFYGFQPMPAGNRVVTEETIERLREQEGI